VVVLENLALFLTFLLSDVAEECAFLHHEYVILTCANPAVSLERVTRSILYSINDARFIALFVHPDAHTTIPESVNGARVRTVAVQIGASLVAGEWDLSCSHSEIGLILASDVDNAL